MGRLRCEGWFVGFLLGLGLVACAPAEGGTEAEVGTAPAAAPAPAPAGPARGPAAVPASAPLVVFLGDSISAGLHLPQGEAFPAVIQEELAAEGLPFRLVNAGVSGDTTAGGRARLEWLLSQEPDVVVVELGGNDGLRGVSLDAIEANLRAILEQVREAGARPLLLGMRLPTNYGDDYGVGFARLYERLADELDVPLVPFFMRGVAGRPDLNLPDGLHPSAAGQRVLAEEVLPHLRPVLEQLTAEAP